MVGLLGGIGWGDKGMVKDNDDHSSPLLPTTKKHHLTPPPSTPIHTKPQNTIRAYPAMDRTLAGQPPAVAPEEPATATALGASPSTDIMEEPPPYESVGASEAAGWACLFFCWWGVWGGGC